MPGLGAQPFAEFAGGVVGHGDGGQTVFIAVAHAQVHGGVGGGRLRNGVPQFVIRLFLQKLAVLGARTPVSMKAV